MKWINVHERNHLFPFLAVILSLTANFPRVVNKALHGHVSTGSSAGQATVVADDVSLGKGSMTGNAGHELMYLQVQS